MKPAKKLMIVLNLLVALTMVASGWAESGNSSPLQLQQPGITLPPVQGPLPQDDQALEGEGPWVFTAYFTSREMVNSLAGVAIPWEVRHDLGYLVVELDREGYIFAQGLGFKLVLDEKLTRLLHTPLVPLEGQVSGIPGYPCYRTVEETFASAVQITQNYPHLAEWIDIGDSWEKVNSGGAAGYDLMVLILTNENSTAEKAKLFIMASLHAREYTPAELTMRYAEYLVQNYGINPEITWILDHTEIHLLLQANPDGRKKAETGLSWRKNTNSSYCTTTPNSRGTDLNRNYWFKWGCCGGSSSNQCDLTYRGPSPASEPETQVVQNYVRSIFPDQRGPIDSDPAPATATGLFLDLHSYSNLVLWPWGWTYGAAPNAAALQTLGRKFAYFNNYTPQQSTQLYVTDGTTDDFSYGELGLSSYTFELGNAFFESCSAFENTILPDNMPALLYAAKAARQPYLEPGGPDALNVLTLPAAVEAGSIVQLTAQINDTRYNNSNGTEPVHNIVQAEYYIDTAPWQTSPAPTAHPLAAADGSFSSSIENVTGTIDTSGLSEGRHTIFVRGKDASGRWGHVSAAFLYVIDPVTSPVIEGYVRSSADSTPVSALVSAGSFSAAADPATGYYRLYLLPGSYTLQAAAEGYASASVSGIVLEPGQTVQQNVLLDPICTLFFDSVESGSQDWTAQTSWGITNLSSNSPTQSWTDSPGSTYSNNVNTSLTSKSFNFSSASGIELEFWHRYDLENNYDYAHVEYSINGGTTWVNAVTYNGEGQTSWRKSSLPLPALNGTVNAKVRFRLATDVSVVRDGWYIDDIRITGGGSTCVPPLPPQADFNSSAPAAPGEIVRFTNLTIGTHPLTYHWDFGDGQGSSTASDPSYTFAAPGGYTVSLEASSAYGTDVVEKQVTIYSVDISGVELEQVTQPAFAGIPVSYQAELIPGYATWPYTYTVSFGDGSSPLTGTSSANPLTFDHTFSEPGLFNIEIALANAHMAEPVTDSLQTSVAQANAFKASLAEAELSGLPGETLTYTAWITNTSMVPESFQLELIGSVWEAALSDGLVESVLPGETFSVTLSISIPPDALAYQTDSALLLLTVLEDPAQAASLPVSASVQRVLGQELLVPVEKIETDPGQSASYLVRLTNTGNYTETYHLIFTSTWPVSAAFQQSLLESGIGFALDPGQGRTLVFTVSVPAEAGLGSENVVELLFLPQSPGGAPVRVELLTRVQTRTLFIPLIQR